MSTDIEWTEDTWNPVLGCSKVSAGCEGCYALRDSWRLAHNPKQRANYEGLTKKVGPAVQWTGKIRCLPDRLSKPLETAKPTTYFVNSMSDLFHEGVPDEFIDRVFAVMALCPQHTFQILTKRPERMAEYAQNEGRLSKVAQRAAIDFKRATGSMGFSWPPPNVWLGVSVEDQATADERIPHLLRTPAAVRFVSYEPALGPVDFGRWLPSERFYVARCEHCGHVGSTEFWGEAQYDDDADVVCPKCQKISLAEDVGALDWVICGGESGPGARPMHPDWPRSVRDQCAAAGVPFFFKQHGEYMHESQVTAEPVILASEWERAMDLGSKKPGIASHDWPDGTYSIRVKKKRAGRKLDGELHDARPPLAHEGSG